MACSPHRRIVAALALFLALKICAHGSPVDVCKESYPSIPFKWRSRSKVLALTFDDGPDTKGLPAVLDVLSHHNIRATFFFNTNNKNSWLGAYSSPGNQAMVRRVLSFGHEIGSHAAQHVFLTNLTQQQMQEQISWATSNISRTTGLSSIPLFRAPYGDGYQGDSAAAVKLQQLVRRQHIHVAWSYSGDDFRLGGVAGCADALFNAYGPPVVQQGITGIVLMHSTPNAMGGCPQGLDRSIQAWRDAGYSFVTVSQLVRERYGGSSPEQVVAKSKACPPASAPAGSAAAASRKPCNNARKTASSGKQQGRQQARHHQKLD